LFARGSAGFAKRTSAGECDVFTYSIPVSGSNAPPPQFAPPINPGTISMPSSDGGVYRGPRRYFFISAWASALSSGVRSNASSSVTPCGENAGGLVGNGCVGHASSPGTSLFGAGRSSMGHTGLPVTRSNT
jgi:hypothetical protein